MLCGAHGAVDIIKAVTFSYSLPVMTSYMLLFQARHKLC